MIRPPDPFASVRSLDCVHFGGHLGDLIRTIVVLERQLRGQTRLSHEFTAGYCVANFEGILWTILVIVTCISDLTDLNIFSTECPRPVKLV
jgi:hypothetical protein